MPPQLKMSQFSKIYKAKTSPKTTGIIEANAKYVHIYSYQTRHLTVYNEVKSQSILPMPTHICNFSKPHVNIFIFYVKTSTCKGHAF